MALYNGNDYFFILSLYIYIYIFFPLLYIFFIFAHKAIKSSLGSRYSIYIYFYSNIYIYFLLSFYSSISNVPNSLCISVNVFPFVSTKRKITKITLNAQINAKKKKTGAIPTASTTLENDTVTINANIQLNNAADVEAVPFNLVGKISPI